MALYGYGGVVELGRERPEPTVLTLERIEGQNLIVQNSAFWPSDLVTITSSAGLPLDLNGDGYADCPDGHGIYVGSKWELGPNRAFWLPWIELANPVPRVIHARGASLTENDDRLVVTSHGFQTGERVVLTGFGGLPLDLNEDGYPDNPDGLGIYGGSTWRRGPNTESRTGDNSYFYIRLIIDGQGPDADPDTVFEGGGPTPGGGEVIYGDDSTTLFYDSYVDVGYAIQVVYYVRVAGDNLYFYTTKDGSTIGSSIDRVQLLRTGFRRVILSRFNPDISEESLALLRDYAEQIYLISDTSYSTVDLTSLIDVDYTVYLPPNTVPYYTPEDDDPFYATPSTVGFSTSTDLYISRDEFDRIKLYTNALGALNEGETYRVPLHNVDSRTLLLTLYSGTTGYRAGLLHASQSVNALPLASLPGPEFTLASAVTPPEIVTRVNDEPLWKQQGDLQSWAMDIDASALDTSAIGDTYGDAIKAMVRGAGSLQFLVERRENSALADALAILKLVLLTQQGSKASAKFYMYKDRDLRTCVDQGVIMPQGSLYYACDILLSNSKVSTSAEDLINGSADFVVVGEPKLRASGLLNPEIDTTLPPLINRTDFLDQHAFCVSVIDECNVPQAILNNDWYNFRAAWPERTFTLLVPGQQSDVPLPAGWNGTVHGVNRDLGFVGARSDWFALAGLSYVTAGEIVYLYVDQSGSMTTATVQASYDYFLERCSAAQLQVIEVSSPIERYIAPFVSTPDPDEQ